MTDVRLGALLERARDGDRDSLHELVRELNPVLWSHFSRLSQRCRDLLGIVAQVTRPDYSAIAEAYGMPHGSIGPTRGRCLAKLREMLFADPAWGA